MRLLDGRGESMPEVVTAVYFTATYPAVGPHISPAAQLPRPQTVQADK